MLGLIIIKVWGQVFYPTLEYIGSTQSKHFMF